LDIPEENGGFNGNIIYGCFSRKPPVNTEGPCSWPREKMEDCFDPIMGFLEPLFVEEKNGPSGVQWGW